jgi:hypothetical protein
MEQYYACNVFPSYCEPGREEDCLMQPGHNLKEEPSDIIVICRNQVQVQAKRSDVF